MLRFNWQKIKRVTGGNLLYIKPVFQAIVSDIVPKNRRDPIYKFYGMDFSGDSFLVKPKLLLAELHLYSSREVAEYLALASYRSAGEYYALRQTTLDFAYSTVSEAQINKNKLLKLENGLIYFLYEDK